MIYFCSDPHYSHKNLVRGTSTWEYKDQCRDFDTIKEHDNALVNGINSVVGVNDTLWCLGDWAFAGAKSVVEFRHRINCKNVALIYGNHDQVIQKDAKLKALFSRVAYYAELDLKVKIVLCHYAMRVWNGSHRGSIMLYGHSHGTLDELRPDFTDPTWIGNDYYLKNYRTMDVGFECLPDFKPISLEEVMSKMLRRDILLNVDHHGN